MQFTGTIQFLLGHEPREIGDVAPTTTVLQYLRQTERMTGTKEGCAEGDCGACTVALGRCVDGRMHYEAVNSCIMFLPFLNGRQLVTVEHLKQANGQLHPVQRAMVDEHASQCGFCTPGFVMSIFAMAHQQVATDRQTIDDALAGNLCRCTGYVPIVRAARKVLSGRVDDEFSKREQETIENLNRINARRSVRIRVDEKLYLAPTNIAELSQMLDEYPQSSIVAGATDVGLWVTKQGRDLGSVVYIGGVAELKQISVSKNTLSIGAGVTVTRAMQVLSRYYPSMTELFQRYGSVQIRNLATLGGNVANGSPIGDSLPALVALQAQFVVTSKKAERVIQAEDFFIDYGVQDLRPGEFLKQIIIPLPEAGQQFRIYKLSKRFHQDISAVCGAFSLTLKNKTQVISARVCFGGMAPVPQRAKNCEEALVEHGLNARGIDAAGQALERDYDPITDFRGSRAYRSVSAANLVERLINDIQSGQTQTVWTKADA